MTPLAPAWVAWIAQNALRGASPEDLAAGLVAGGVAPERAAREVEAVLSSPILAGARTLVARSAGVEQAARLRRTLDDGAIAERTTIDVDTLHREHWTPNRPLILRGAASEWIARSWTPADLAARVGDVDVDVLVGRSKRTRWWHDREGITRRIPFAELARMCAGPAGDDVYADGRTNLLDVPGLAVLRSELGTLPGLQDDGFPKAWIGPAETLTPLHHDQSTGWFVQLFGRKRFWMASPLESALMSTAIGVYNDVDPRQPQSGELAEVRWHTLDLGPGDALLVTVGWWHQVLALTPSISVSMGRFRWGNAHPWYCPGRH